MANSVSDIVINITANASKAIEGLNQLKTQVTTSVNSTRAGMSGMDSAMIKSGELIQSNMGAAANALGMFERQSGIHFRAAGNQVTGVGGRITVLGKDIKSSLTSAGRSVTSFGNNLKQKLGTESALAFAAAGTAALSFSKQCVSAAMNAESSWTRYGALVNSSGGNWQQQQKEVKDWARTVSNNYGFAVSDTREASAALMQAGNSFDFVKNNMASVSALAARTGTTQAEAANMITMALNGRANALRKATGLEIENYRAADGTIDKQRLMTDILNQNKDALDAHSDTTEAAVARMENAWGSFKTSIGNALLPVVQTLVPIIQRIAETFNKLPQPVKTAIAVFLVVGGAIGVIVGALGLLAPAFVTLGGLISSFAAAGGVVAWLGTQVTLVSAAFPGLAAAFGFVAANLLPIIAIVGAVVGALYLLYEAGKRLGWWNDLGGMFSKFGETLSWVGGQIMGFIGWLGLLVTDFPAAMNQLSSFIDNIGPAIGNFMNQLGPLLSTMGDIIGEALGNLGSMIADKIGGGDLTTGILRLVAPIPMIIYNALAYIAPMVLPALHNLGNSIILGLSDALGGAGSAIADALSGVGDWIMNGLSNAFNSAQARVEEIVGGFWNVLTGALQGDLGSIYDGLIDLFGPQLATTIMSGISAAVDMVMGAGNLLAGIGTSIVDGLRSIPSRVMGALGGLGRAIQMKLLEARLLAQTVMTTLANRIVNAVRTIPTRLAAAFMRIVTVIRLRLNQARAIAGTLMTQLRNAVVNRILSIPQRVGMIFQLVVQFIRTRLVRAWAIAQQVAGQIRQAIVDKIMEMYHGVQQWFSTLASNIGSWLSTAASNTLSGAKQIYDNIVNKVKEIPGKVAEEFGKIPGKISSALAQAASAALTGAANIVSSFLSGMSINSPGKIQRWTQWEFESIPRNIFTSGVEASRNAYNAATNIVRSWTDAMPEILQPQVEFANTPNIHDLRRNIPIDTLTSNIQQMHAVPSSANVLPSTTNNVRNEDNTRHITVENITLECNDLTQAQSRRILYNALQGL